MTVHRIRLVHSTTGAAEYHGWLSTWLTNMAPWDAPEVTNQPPPEREPLADGAAPYHQGDLAFAWSEDRALILDNLAQYAAAYCEWYRIAYHECTHDEADPEPCAWGEVREGGTVPDHVPDFTTG